MPEPGKTCGAPTRHGRPCGRSAGWGTDHPARGRCRQHENESGPEPEESDPEITSPDPARRLGALARMMSRRALAAHDRARNGAAQDSDAAEARIIRAVRAAIQATRVELAARKALAAGDDNPTEIVVTVRRIGPEDEPKD